MATTVPAAQRKRKRSAKRNNQELPPPIHIDNNNNNIIKFEKKKAADVLPSPIDLDIDNNIIEYEILPKLPAKSICRFKSVSKHWKSFLSTPMFGKMHHHLHHISKSYKILLLDQPPVDLCCKPLNHGSITIGFNRLGKADPRFDLLLASLDGLVCVASTETINSLAFWNPFTGAYYKLPCNPNFTRPFDIDHDVLGFYSDNDDYKLLYKVFVDHWSCRVYIYSHRMNSWRNIEFLITGNYHPDPFLHDYPWTRATFFDHSLYFLVYKDSNDLSIICFDVNTEDFREIQFPPFLPSEARFHNHAMLMVIDGFIHLCVGYEIGCWLRPLTQGSMWKLNVDDGTWAEVAFFPARRLCDSPHRICMTRNARDSCISISEGGRDNAPFRVMNMEEFTLTKHSLPMHTYRRIIYDETLVSPNPLYDDMVGHSNDAKATVAACKAADQAVNVSLFSFSIAAAIANLVLMLSMLSISLVDLDFFKKKF